MNEPVVDVVSGYDHPGYRQDDTAPFDVVAFMALFDEYEAQRVQDVWGDHA